MEFGWSDADRAYRRQIREFLETELPGDWEERSKGGPGSEAQARFSREFAARLAQRGWLTPHWPRSYGGTHGEL